MSWWKNRSAAPQEAEAYDDVTIPEAGAAAEPPKTEAPKTEAPKTEAAKTEAAKTETPKPATEHPVLTAAIAAGVTTSAQFADMHECAQMARQDLQAQSEREAVRCFGPDAGPAKAKALESASYADAKQITGLWRETADAKYGIGKEGQAPRRQTKPASNEDFAASAGQEGAPAVQTPSQIYGTRQAQSRKAAGAPARD